MKSTGEQFWEVPREWDGEAVVLMAGGMGMTADVAKQVYASGLHSIAVNNTFRLAPFADVLYAADPEWWRHEANADAFKFAGRKVSVSHINSEVLRLRNTGIEGLDDSPTSLRTGSNSGYQALHLAYHFGAKKIILCGYNLTGEHWHGRHVKGLRETTEEQYARFRARYDTIVKPLRERGVDVVNCTPGSALKAFRVGILEDELCAAL